MFLVQCALEAYCFVWSVDFVLKLYKVGFGLIGSHVDNFKLSFFAFWEDGYHFHVYTLNMKLSARAFILS